MVTLPAATCARLRRRARFGLLLTGLVLGFDLAGFRSTWLLPKPLFCGEIVGGRRWVPDVRPDLHLEPGNQAVCVHELIHPYSSLSGSATVSMSLREADGSLRLWDMQCFLARNVGPRRHNDTPGDWIFLNEATYSPRGWLQHRSTLQVASWSSNVLSLDLRQQIWKTMQDRLISRNPERRVSLQRSLAVFVAINGALVVVIWLVLSAVLELIREHGPSLAIQWSRRRLLRVWSRLTLFNQKPGWRRRLLVAGGLAVVVVFLLVSRFTRWVQPRPFWCGQYAGGWRICLHEIHRLPSDRLRMIVLGVSIRKPDRSSLYAKMQVFTALPSDNIGFVDVPGSWHFMDRFYYDQNGMLVLKASETLSSIVDPLVPRTVQIRFWNDIAHKVQFTFRARRLSVNAKLLEVSETYLMLLLGVLLAIWTLLILLELRLLSLGAGGGEANDQVVTREDADSPSRA